jgi:hypothetical protein
METEANWKNALTTVTENSHDEVLHSADFGDRMKNCAGHWRFAKGGLAGMLAAQQVRAVAKLPDSQRQCVKLAVPFGVGGA